jgi:hypothetical protein
MSGWEMVRALVSLVLACVPIGLSLWAFLDVAHRPAWAWALADRNRLVWLAAIGLGVLFCGLGVVVSVYYLVRVRPQIAAVESGRL